MNDEKICEGVSIDESFWNREEKRIYTLLLKGFLVYLTAMGGIGSYLSAVGISFRWLTVNLVLLAVSLFCALCFYRRLFENIGYIIIFLFTVLYGYRHRTEVNHGFYIVINRTLEHIAEYFNLKSLRTYELQEVDPYRAVTVSAIFIGIIFCVILNVLITRHMQYAVVLPMTVVLLLIPLYMDLQTGPGYLMMLLAGLTMLFILRGGKNYHVTGNDKIYEKKKKSREIIKIKSIYNFKTSYQAFAVTVFAVVLVVLIVYTGVSKERLEGKSRANVWKKSTQDQMEVLISSGLEGFFNQYDSTGGMNHGRLGGVSSVSLDYETDLEVTFAPYTSERIYLKSYDGAVYLPYENRWSSEADGKDYSYDKWMHDEAWKLQAAYEAKADYTAKGKMRIVDVVEGRTEVYVPYYTTQITYDSKNHNAGAAEYYPRLLENRTQMWMYQSEDKETYYQPLSSLDGQDALWEEDSVFLDIPDENYSVISDLCESQNIQGTPEEITGQIASYFQENIPYTYTPGKTPKNRDFVNYFLTEKKKGLCTHFASAAVLMFRYRGIPARYVEGYVIDYGEVLDGTLTKEAYEDYYDGYSQLGETGVVKVEVTDADAHAWVEIFTPEKGWHPAEVTPSANESADGRTFWGTFFQMLSADNGGAEKTENAGEQADLSGKGEHILHGAGKTVIAVFLGLLCAGVLYVLLRYRNDVVTLRRANRNDRLILVYQKYLGRIKKREEELKDRLNYEEQIQYLKERGYLHFSSEEERERMLRILNQAGFSDREITEGEYEEVLQLLKKGKRGEKS